MNSDQYIILVIGVDGNVQAYSRPFLKSTINQDTNIIVNNLSIGNAVKIQTDEGYVIVPPSFNGLLLIRDYPNEQ